MEPEPATAMGKDHFGDRDLGFGEQVEDGLPAKRGSAPRNTITEPGRLTLVEADDYDSQQSGDEDGNAAGGSGRSRASPTVDLTAAAIERAQKAHAFGTIRIGTLDIEASYTGKMMPASVDRLPLHMKTINYKREVWTMQELLEHLGWDIKKAVAKSLANSTISGMGSRMSKLGGQMLAPAAGAKRSLFEKKKQSLLGQMPPPAGSDRKA